MSHVHAGSWQRWCILLLAAAAVARAQESQPVELLKTDSQAPYVHRLTLYDEDGKVIDPAAPQPAPYSPTATCGKCHEVGEIAHGWHFNAWDPNVPGGRPGEPWIIADPRTGTVLPVSGRRWPGTFTPQQVGLSDWQFVLRFGGHTPGGGYGDPSNEVLAKSREAARWRISGRLEVDCMFCHSGDQQHDPAEAAKQIEAQNFRWAPTVALGLAVVRGEARKAPDDWDPTAPPNPDYPEQSGPRLIYDTSRFDPDNRVLFNIVRRPAVGRCYFCHTVREVGPSAPEDLVAPRDVHIAAGLVCVDCHRAEVDHEIVRGYDTEAEETGQPWRAAFTCEGCHLGTGREYLEEDEEQNKTGDSDAESEEPAVRLGGRYAAPHPEHRGLPPVHLEKLTCTACHSGPWAEMTPEQVQTALAHGLGLATRDRRDSDLPILIEPIFAKQPDGKLAPQRMFWPAFYGRLEGEQITPILPDAVLKAAGQVLPKLSATQEPQPPTDDQVAKVLEALAGQSGQAAPVYVFGGAVRRRTATGKLETIQQPFGEAYRWSLAHDVRPAAQALGVRGCTDCHARDSGLFFGATGLSNPWAPPTGQPMVLFREDDLGPALGWAWMFPFRPAFKWFGFVCAAIVFLALLGYALDGVAGRSYAPSAAIQVAAPGAVPVPPRGLTRWEHVFHILAAIGVVLLAITGFGPKLVGAELKDWVLIAHLAAAPLLILGLAGMALQWSARCRFAGRGGPFSTGLNLAQRQIFWIALLLGFVSLTTPLIAMLPIYGPADQRTVIEVHSYSSLLLLIAMVPHTVVSWRARRARRKLT